METIDQIDLRMLRCFEASARHGSFSEAGRRLDLPRAVVSRLIEQLENRVGAKLFQRTTRKVVLTDQGEVLRQQLESPLAALRESLLAAEESTSNLGGVVRLSASHAYGRRFVLPSLAAFRTSYPDIRIETFLSDQIDDLIDDQLDLTIRLGELPDSSMIARKLADLEVVLAIPSELIADRRPPDSISDLSEFPTIGYRVPGTGDLYAWTFEGQGERYSAAPQSPMLVTDSIEGVADLVRCGLGVAPVPKYLLSEELRTGTVVAGLSNHNLPAVPVHLCFTSREHLPQRVRVLIDCLATHLRT
ncbi:MAG: LysR family transcriptional regulator [Woeseiaceae bacterium]|nr:LysR family transcriptional regulator [Woeseiaceae bacterium]